MERVLPDKLSPSLDLDSLLNAWKSEEESEVESYKKLSPRKMSRKTSMRAASENPLLDRPEENNLMTLRDSKF